MKRTVLVGVAAVVTLGCGMVRTPMGSGPQEKPAAAPGNVCTLVGAELLAQVVPVAKTPKTDLDTSRYSNTAKCDVETDPEKATTSADGKLDVEVERNGSSYSRSAAGEATYDHDFDCKHWRESQNLYGKPVEISGVGERICAAVETADASRVTVHLSTTLGADRVEITYRARPSDGPRALAAARAVATNVLARLP